MNEKVENYEPMGKPKDAKDSYLRALEDLIATQQGQIARLKADVQELGEVQKELRIKLTYARKDRKNLLGTVKSLVREFDLHDGRAFELPLDPGVV